MLMFSVILPTFNRGHMIHLAIRSVLTQTYKDWELIIVDDGSKDNTKDVIDKFIAKDNRIRYLFQKNKERSVARNNGIKNAKGDWICFLDSDDIYHTTHLEEFKNLITKEGSKIGLYFSGLSFGKFSASSEEYDLSHKNNIEFVLLNTIGTPRACVHKSILMIYQFNEKIRIGEDRELWVRILKSHPLFFHNKKTFIEIEHPNRSVNLAAEMESLKTLKIILKSKIFFVRKKVKNKVLSNSIFNISKMYLRKNQRTMAFLVIGRAILKDPSNKQNKHRILLLLSLIGLYKPIYSEYEK